MNKFNNFTIIVNSSDGFEDYWDPFFKLFSYNWSNCEYPILLNTENKEYTNPFKELNIVSTKSNNIDKTRRLTWSECLIEALNQVKTRHVLYFQEDYFIENKVRVGLIEEFANLMLEKNEIKYIGLTHFDNNPPFTSWEEDERLWIVNPKAKYRISMQAALWDKNTLLNYLRPEESGWMFEIFGSQRAKKKKELFLTTNRNMFNSNDKTAIIDYVHTGIIKGKWHFQIPQLFKINNIEIDFKKRGFYEPKPAFLNKIDTLKRLIKEPKMFIKYLFKELF